MNKRKIQKSYLRSTHKKHLFWSGPGLARKKYLFWKDLGLENKEVVLTEKYSIPFQSKDPLNTIVISSVGTGKTRGFLKSNILQAGCSFVIVDTKGDLVQEFEPYLREFCGYKTKVLDLQNPEWSNHYNPLAYMHYEEDILDFALTLAANISKNPNDSFWLNATKNMLASFLFYMVETMPREEWNVANMLKLFKAVQTKEENRKAPLPNEYEQDIYECKNETFL